VALNDAYTVFNTPYTKMYSVNPQSEILTCLEYKGHSFIITKLNGTISVMRGKFTKYFNYDLKKLIFDHYTNKLYSFKNHKLYEINMTLIDNFWFDFSNKNISYIYRSYLLGEIKDIMVFNNTQYFIREWPVGKFKIIKRYIGEIKEEILTLTKYQAFDFIPFIQISNFYEGNPKFKLSLGSAPTIAISLPSSNIKNKEQLSIPLIILLYILDVIFVLLTVWAFKYIFKFSKTKLEALKNMRNSQSADTNTSYITLASLPLIKSHVPNDPIIKTSGDLKS
jgi:hypothetical protein